MHSAWKGIREMRTFFLLPKAMDWLWNSWVRGHWAFRFISSVFELIQAVGSPEATNPGWGPTDLPASEWPPRIDRPCALRKSYELWHPVVKGTGILPQLTVLDTLKTWFMIHENDFFRGTLWLCFGPRNKLATINSLEEVVFPPHNSSFWGQWLCSVC